MFEALRIFVALAPASKTIGRHGLGDKKSLHNAALEPPQYCILQIGLDALAYDVELHRFTQRNYCLHNSRIRTRLGQVRNKGLVDLQCLHGQLGKIAQR